MRYTVTMQRLTGEREVRTETVDAESAGEARVAAIRRWYGPRAGWHADSGLGPNYGQVTEPVRDSGAVWSATTLTPRVRIDVEVL